MSRYRRAWFALRRSPPGVVGALSVQVAAVFFQVCFELAKFHAAKLRCTGSVSASAGISSGPLLLWSSK